MSRRNVLRVQVSNNGKVTDRTVEISVGVQGWTVAESGTDGMFRETTVGTATERDDAISLALYAAVDEFVSEL